MDIEQATEGQDPVALPRFQRAEFHIRHLRLIVFSVGIAAILSAIFAWLTWLFSAAAIWMPVLCNVAASFLLLVAAARSALVPAGWRQHSLAALNRSQPPEQLEPPSPDQAGVAETAADAAVLHGARLHAVRMAERVRIALQSIGREPIELGAWALFALLIVRHDWTVEATAIEPGMSASVVTGVLLAAAFALLVVERGFAAASEAEWPEAAGLSQITRAAVLTLFLSALCLVASKTTSLWPTRLACILGLLPAAIAIELIIRAVFALFRPHNARREPQATGTSVVAAMLRWPPPPLLSIVQDELRSRTAIDLRQVWAFGFIRRALPLVLAVILVAGWLLSGVSEVPLNGRGIYERFGRPEAVMKPGLHVGLPWPFGRVVAVENGAVHELTATYSRGNRGEIPLPPAEGPAPASANRLWDVVHDTDRSQIIASTTDGKQTFQIVDLDIRFFYRIGPTDNDALAATYNVADLQQLVRSTAGEVLVKAFASRNLDSVLGVQRAGLSHEIQTNLQQRLTRTRTGVEILAVVIEAIHPPAGAADAYHAVQAAQINAQRLVAQQKGEAEKTESAARTAADADVTAADAEAHETLALAKAERTRTNADVTAYREAGQAFLLERYLGRLTRGMSGSSALIVDDRLLSTTAPTIDLRNLAFPLTPQTESRKAGAETARRPETTP